MALVSQPLPDDEPSIVILEKEITRALVNSLDDQSLWVLARELHSRGDVDILGLFPGMGGIAGQQFESMVVSGGKSTTLGPGATRLSSAPGLEAVSGTSYPTKKSASAGTAAGADGKDAEASVATSLILRNLPSEWTQHVCQNWVDESYKGLYDFLLWFPPKKTARINQCSYAFVNFITAHHASRFKLDFHMHRFTDTKTGHPAEWAVSVAVAKVQGFVDNYIRFVHLLDSGSETLCAPYFDPKAVAGLTQEQLERASRTTMHFVQHIEENNAGSTIVIRNLPSWMDSQQAARDWFDNAGFADQYDFFAYIPSRKKASKDTRDGTTLLGLAYAFVNFASGADAKSCLQQLHGQKMKGGEEPLNVVHSRVQGYQECVDRFDSLREPGCRIEPWTAPGMVRMPAASGKGVVGRAVPKHPPSKFQ